MKSPKKMQILFFCLIPVGIIILIFAIRMVQKTTGGSIILEIPYSQKSADFEITRTGKYSIWHLGQFFRKAPLDEFRPVITNKSTGEETVLSTLLFRPNMNNGITARMELFRFSLPAGKYRLQLLPGSSISGVEDAFIRRLPLKKVDTGKYFIQVRATQPFILLIAGILLLVLAGFCIIGGLVVGILFDQIFKS
jgi:hypothetical protein